MFSRRTLALTLLLAALFSRVNGITNSKVFKDKNRYPFMTVVATSKGMLQCGSVLISKEKKWFLTAGRCFTDIGNNELLSGPIVAGGSMNMSEMKAFSISKVVVHPYFNRFNNANDIALFRVDNFNLDAEAIALPDPDLDLDDFKKYTTLGWGDYGIGMVSQVARRGNVTGITDSAALCKMVTNVAVLHKIICGTGSVLGEYDYGSPLIAGAENLDDDTNDTLVGIGSFYKGKVSLYTDVRPYLDWIKNVIDNEGKVNFCESPCSNKKELVNSDGSACVLSSGEPECTMTQCKFYCPLGDLENGKCDNDCDNAVCHNDNNSCSHTISDHIVDPSFENDKQWNPLYQYITPITSGDYCQSLNLTNFNCNPVDGDRMILTAGFPKESAANRDIYVYSNLAQRMRFPAGTSYLSFYLQVSCGSMNAKEYVDITIDQTPFLKLNASECSKYSARKGNWTWMAIPLPKQFTNGQEHTILFEFYLGASVPSTIFALDVIRFVSASPLSGADDGVYAAGPCADGGHPVVGSGADDGVCGWQPITCCSGTKLGERVRTVIYERGNSTCSIASACLKMLRTLTCIDCAPIDYAAHNSTSGRHRICKDYSKYVHAACKESEINVNDRSCVRMGSMFESPKDIVEYFLGEYAGNNDRCFSMNYSQLLTPDEMVYMDDMLKDKDGGLSSGAIAAIIIVCVVVVALVVVFVFLWFIVYRPRHREHGNDTDRMYGSNNKKKKKQGAGGKKGGDKKDKKDTLKKGGDKKDKKDTLKKSGSKKGNNDIELETTAKKSKKSDTVKKTKKSEEAAADNDGGEEEKKKTKKAKTMKNGMEEIKDDTDRGEKKTMKSEKKKEDTMKKKKKSKGSAAPADTYEEEISY